MHNTEKAPKPTPEDRFGQNIEPSGKYMSLLTPKGGKSQVAYNKQEGLKNLEIGEIEFKNPLIIEAKGTSKEWKAELSKKI